MENVIEQGTQVVVNGTITGTVTNIAHGWITVEYSHEGQPQEAKVRRSQIEIAPTVEADDSDSRIVKIQCYECDHSWDIEYQRHEVVPENVRCPKCGAWCRVRLHPDLDNYVRGLGTTASGNSTLDINDHVAQILRGLDIGELYNVLAAEIVDAGTEYLAKTARKELGESITAEALVDHFSGRWADRNVGMQRMNAGNVLRGVLKRKASAEEGDA